MQKKLNNKSKSWLMCAGLMPPPESIVSDVYRGELKQSKEMRSKPRCFLTEEAKALIKKESIPLLKQKLDYSEIYVELEKKGLLKDKVNDSVASFSVVSKIIGEAAKKLNIKKETLFEKVARLRKEGYSDYDILMMGINKRYLVKKCFNGRYIEDGEKNAKTTS